MAILSAFRYPGAKNRLLPQLAPFLQTLLKDASQFGDLFIGGGSVLLDIAFKYPKLELFANDKDDYISSYWKIIGSSNILDLNELLQRLQQKPTIELFSQLRNTIPISEIDKAYYAIFFNRTTFSGDTRRNSSPIGGYKQTSKYKVDCRYNKDKLIERIKFQHKILNGRLTVFNEDILDNKIFQDKNIPIYLDPPYAKVGHMMYEKFMLPKDHQQLASSLQERNNWVLSYDNFPMIKELYQWANINYLDARYSIKGTKKSWEKTNELVIIPKWNV